MRAMLLARLVPTVLAAVLIAAVLATAGAAAPPTVNVPSDITKEATSANGAVVTFTVSSSDGSPVACDHNSGDTFPIKTTLVTCTATNADGTGPPGTFNVTVQDTTPPSIAPIADINGVTHTPSGTVVETFTASATDLVDGTDPVTCAPASGTAFGVGSTLVTCNAQDKAGNTATRSFHVIISYVDNTPPTITVPADITGVQATEHGGAHVSFTVTASDPDDAAAAITLSCSPASGSLFPIATTLVTCNAHDAAGNNATPQSFHVTVVDTTPPVVTVPGNITVEATSPSGAVVTFSATATDIVDGSLTPSCTPHKSGDTFPFGTTTVTCSATDSHGNPATPKSFTVTVADRTPPTFSNVPADITVEANGPAGSVVHYTNPTATDDIDGPIAQVTCTPASGSTFALGPTSVSCGATDSHGNTGTASFTVHVVDTTPPHLIVPGNGGAYATLPTGASVTDSTVKAWLASASASDLADPHPTVTNDAPSVLPFGTTVVTFVAKDASGNTVSATAKLTVFPQPSGTPPPLPPPPDRQPPDNVGSLVATAGDGSVRLAWKLPTAPDFASVVITRSLSAGTNASVVYRGAATSFVDHGVKDGVEYRYVVVAVDKAGNSSGGVAVVAAPKRSALRSPPNGARVHKPPVLAWTAVPNARYYNVQLFRGKTKIFSAWPVKATLTLQARWTFGHVKYRLTPGVYHWYVWPGFGPRADVSYGTMLGSSTFTIGP